MEVPELWIGAFEETWGLFCLPGAEVGPEGWEIHASLDHKLPGTIPSPKFLRYLNLCPPTQRTTEETRTWNNDWQNIPPVLAGGDKPDLICLMIPWRDITEKKNLKSLKFFVYIVSYLQVPVFLKSTDSFYTSPPPAKDCEGKEEEQN